MERPQALFVAVGRKSKAESKMKPLLARGFSKSLAKEMR